MASIRQVVLQETRRRALVRLDELGPAVFDAWRADPTVAEVRWLAGGLTSTLRTSLDLGVRDFAATADSASGLGCVSVLQALVLEVLNGGR